MGLVGSEDEYTERNGLSQFVVVRFECFGIHVFYSEKMAPFIFAKK